MINLCSPLEGKTTDWRAVCGRSACTVRREGAPAQPVLPTPIVGVDGVRGVCDDSMGGRLLGTIGRKWRTFSLLKPDSGVTIC